MVQPDVRLARIIARRLSAALEVRNERRADKRIDRIMRRSLQSEVRFESTFAAIQAMRDMDVVDGHEAAYLFDYILNLRQWNDDTPLDPALAQLAQEPGQVELLMAAMSDHDLVETEAF